MFEEQTHKWDRRYKGRLREENGLLKQQSAIREFTEFAKREAEPNRL
ncbi:MAG: hypothetical protein ACE144_19180 [Thermodesulfobacteriota bacterium]